MPCLYSNCQNAALPGSESWGLSQGVCDMHFSKAKESCINKQKAFNLDKPLHEDYARIYILLEHDKAKVHECLHALANELGNLEGRDGYVPNSRGKGFIKLAAALERYESYCWFPKCRETFIAQLTAEQFFSYLARGLMAKDPGAGPAHGDFTHRIHWHVVARVITNGFTTPKRAGWEHTPLKLFTSLGSGAGRALNVWTWLFETGGKQSYRFPDTFNAHIIGGQYGVLSTNMARRFEKRERALGIHFDKDEYERLNDGSASYVRGDSVPRQKHAWYKIDAIGKANADYEQRQRAKYAALNPEHGPIIKRENHADTMTIQMRINRSYDGFAKHDPNDQLVYNKKLGMLKLLNTRYFRR